MEINIEESKDNIALNRKDIRFVVKHPKAPTPKRADVGALIAKQFGVDQALVVVEHMHTPFGAYTTEGEARIYKNKEEMLSTENEHILIRNGIIEKKEEE